MLPYHSSRPLMIVLAVFFLAVILYGSFEARNILYGPRIDIVTPTSPLSATEPLLHIRGTAVNITELRVNGTPVPVTEAGAFDEALLLAPGYNKVVLEASDKLGRKTTKLIEIVYSESADTKATTATTSNSL